METNTIIEYAPLIIVILMYLYQNKVFVRPSDLEKKHIEILKEIKQNYVELDVYNEFKSRVLKNENK